MKDSDTPSPEPLVEFADVNNSLARLVGFSATRQDAKLRNPWTPYIPTLTSHASIVMRWHPDGYECPMMRYLSAQEILRVVGWDDSMWTNGKPCEDAKLMRSLAGNAFSAFAVGPIAITALFIAGLDLSSFSSLEMTRAAREPSTPRDIKDDEKSDIIEEIEDSE